MIKKFSDFINESNENIPQNIQTAIDKLNQLDVNTFIKQCKGKTNEEVAQFISNEYFRNIDDSEIAQVYDRGGDNELYNALSRIGGFALPIVFCQLHGCEFSTDEHLH